MEEQYYILFPLFLSLVLNYSKASPVKILSVAAILSIVLAQFESAKHPDASFYLLPTGGWELLVGAVLACAPSSAIGRSVNRRLFAEWGSLGALVIVLGAMIYYKDTMLHPSFWTAAPVLATAALIRNAGEDDFTNRILRSKALIDVGLISYSFYLWHFPTFAFARIALGEPEPLEKIALIGVSATLAALSYSIVERPFRKPDAVSLRSLVLACAAGFTFLLSVFAAGALGKIVPDKFAAVEELVNFKYDYKNDWRAGTCFLEPSGLKKKSPFEGCEVMNFEQSRRTIFLWGDSHAAHLFPGFDHRYGKRFNIIQRTAWLCQPILGRVVASREGCKEVNDAIMAEIVKNPPDVVVLAAAWASNGSADVKLTVDRIHEAGVNSIVIVGPVPRWRHSLPEQIAAYFADHREAPRYLAQGVSEDQFGVDREFRRFVEIEGLQFQSPIAELCKNKSCLTRVGNSADEITQFDYGHLTRAGSIYVVSRFSELHAD